MLMFIFLGTKGATIVVAVANPNNTLLIVFIYYSILISTDAYTIFNWKGSFQQTFSKFNVSEFVRVDNITDKNYVSSVRVNDSGSRFYEPGTASNWTLGINGSYKF